MDDSNRRTGGAAGGSSSGGGGGGDGAMRVGIHLHLGVEKGSASKPKSAARGNLEVFSDSQGRPFESTSAMTIDVLNGAITRALSDGNYSQHDDREVLLLTEKKSVTAFTVLTSDEQIPGKFHELGGVRVLRVAVQLVQALYYLHSNRIIHRDMKPQHVLVGANKLIKV